MKRSVPFLVGVFVLCLSLQAFAANTNFAGTWSLDKGKSQQVSRSMEEAESVTMTVTQDDKTLTSETKIVPEPQQRRGPTGPQSYNLDGTPKVTEVTGERPFKMTTQAKFSADGKILEVTTVRTMSRDGQEIKMKSVEKWELADEGKVLKISRVSESPQGNRESTMVFTKK